MSSTLKTSSIWLSFRSYALLNQRAAHYGLNNFRYRLKGTQRPGCLYVDLQKTRSFSSMSLPTSQLSLITTVSTNTFQTLPVPEPGPSEILIKNVAVASNPKDWKVPKYNEGYSCVEGNDVAGVVVKLGEGVTEFKVGDRVAAFSKMATKDPKYGAYQEYTVSPAASAFPLGPNTSYEDASTLPLAVMTAALGLFNTLHLPEPPVFGFAPSSKQGIIIYGASTSVGTFACQMAKRAGLQVIGVTGDSVEYAKSFGADVIINYKKVPDLEAALITASAPYEVCHAYDTIALYGSSLLLANVLSKISADGKGNITSIGRQTEEEKQKWPKDIGFTSTWVWTCHGEDIEFGSKYYRLIGKWLDDGSLKPNKVRLMPNGLESVGKGIEMLKNNEVHAEKLVYRIEDTLLLKA